MRRCESFTPSGASLLLSRRLPAEQGAEEPGRAAARVMGRALDLIEPLAVDLLVGLRLADEPLLDEDTPAAHATWHVRREDLTGERGVRPAFQRAGHQERRVAAIDAAAVGRILDEAIGQPAQPDRKVTLALLEAKNVRVRILDPALAAASALSVWRGPHRYEVPVIRDVRGAWIDEVPDALERPLWLTIENDDGALRVKLFVAWSLWRNEGSAEHGAVLDFARAVLADGFEADKVELGFRGGLGLGPGQGGRGPI
jgi:hypothetical protein